MIHAIEIKYSKVNVISCVLHPFCTDSLLIWFGNLIMHTNVTCLRDVSRKNGNMWECHVFEREKIMIYFAF